MAQTFTLVQPRIWKAGFITTQDEEVGGPSQTYYKETASQTFGVGDLVYLDTNGTVAIATVTSHKLNSAILGIAQQAASGVTGAQVRVRALRSSDILVMNAFHTTAATSATAQTDLGAVRGVYYDTAAQPTGTGGKWCVDYINTTPEGAGSALAKVQIVGFVLDPDSAILSSGSYGQPAIGDYLAPLLVRVVPFSVGTDGTSLIRNLYFG